MSGPAEKISGSELDVMEALWQAGEPVPLAPVRERLERERGWDASTVKTLLRRLCEKGAVRAEKREVFYYAPLLSREDYRRWSSRAFLERVYRGSVRDLVANLVDSAELSDKDLRELREILYPNEGGKNG